MFLCRHYVCRKCIISSHRHLLSLAQKKVTWQVMLLKLCFWNMKYLKNNLTIINGIIYFAEKKPSITTRPRHETGCSTPICSSHCCSLSLVSVDLGFNWFWSSYLTWPYSLHDLLLYAVSAEHLQKEAIRKLQYPSILHAQPWLNWVFPWV